MLGRRPIGLTRGCEEPGGSAVGIRYPEFHPRTSSFDDSGSDILLTYRVLGVWQGQPSRSIRPGSRAADEGREPHRQPH